MPKEKKQIKIRDQKPQKDPHGGRHGNRGHQLNSAGTEGGNKDQRHEHRGRNRF